MFDIEPSRTRFAESYGADAGIVMPKNEDSAKDPLDFAQEYANKVVKEHGLGGGFDVTVEASGAEVCVQMGVCMLKAGGTCKSTPRATGSPVSYKLGFRHPGGSREAPNSCPPLPSHCKGAQHQRYVPLLSLPNSRKQP